MYRVALRLFAVLAVAVTMLAGTVSVQAQVQRIAAVVNDEVISSYDLDQRVQLVLSTFDTQPAADQMGRLRGQVLRALIDERLQLQEARRQSIEVSEDEVNEAIGRIAQQNNITVADLNARLTRFGVAQNSLRVQVQTEIAWNKLISSRFARRVAVSDAEVDTVYQRVATNRGAEQWRTYELFLPVDNIGEEDRVRDEAQRLIEQIRQGAQFSALARQFSKSSSASNGGEIGWISSGQLDPILDEALVQMQPGMLAGPIRSTQGFHILAVREKRGGTGGAAPDARITLKQIVVAIADFQNEDEVRAAQDRATAARGRITSCDDVDAIKGEFSPLSGDLGSMAMADMPDDFARAVAGLSTGQTSRPVPTGNGLHVLVVCERDRPVVDEQLRDSIEQTLMRDQVTMLGRRYLRDLRRDSVVDLR